MCMSNSREAVEAIRQGAIRQGAQGLEQQSAATLPTLPALPTLPTMPTTTVQAAQAAAPVSTTAIAGPQAATAAPTARMGGTANRRRRKGDSGLGSLSIGSTQTAAGTGLNIGR